MVEDNCPKLQNISGPKPDAAPAASYYQTPVYIIDDQSDICVSLRLLIRTFGFSSQIFSGAQSFLVALPTLEPGPVMVDLNMADMPGLALLEELAVRGVDWPTIAMTGHVKAPAKARALELGAIEILAKPFSAAALQMALSRAFEALALRQRPDRDPREPG